MKNSNDKIGNRSRDLPVYSAVHQPLRHRVPPTDRSTDIYVKTLLRLSTEEFHKLCCQLQHYTAEAHIYGFVCPHVLCYLKTYDKLEK
jgi:hypothetical protein